MDSHVFLKLLKEKKHYLVHKVLQRHIFPNKIFQLYPEASFNQFQPTYAFFICKAILFPCAILQVVFFYLSHCIFSSVSTSSFQLFEFF